MRHPDEGTGQTPGPLASDGHLDEGTIHAWLDGALGEAESARVERHAASCADCAAMVAEARGLVAAASRILTRLDDVPAGVIPAGAEVTDGATRPASTETIPVRSMAGRGARRRRRWMPAAWTVSAAAAAVLMAVLVTSDDAERMLERATPAAGVRDDAPLPVAAEGAPAAAPLPAASPEVPMAPTETSRSDLARGAAVGAASGAASASAAPPSAQSPSASGGGARALAAAPRQERPGSRTEQLAAGEQAAARQRVEGFVAGAQKVAGAELPSPTRRRLDRAAADSAAAEAGVAGAAIGNAAVGDAFAGAALADTAVAGKVAGLQLAEPPVWTDSLTRARLTQRLGLGRRILSGARLVESVIVTGANELERRSVYELEDGARVTLVEGPSAVSLEAVVTTGADAARPEPEASERAAREERRAAAGAAAPAPAPSPAGAAALADSVRSLERMIGERVIVRPDGVARLEWRDGGTPLALEGELPIERLRALRDRVQR